MDGILLPDSMAFLMVLPDLALKPIHFVIFKSPMSEHKQELNVSDLTREVICR